MKARWLLVLLPAAVGLAVLALTGTDRLANPIFYLRADLGMLLLLIGLLLSVGIAAYIAWTARVEHRHRDELAGVQSQAAEDRHRFLRRLDHELKNPLTAIQAGLANIRDGSDETAKGSALTSVETQVQRVSRLVADLRKLAELETLPLERICVDVAELLREAVALAQEQPEADRRRLNLTLPQAPWPLPAISGDWDLVLLAVYNLLGNALKFTDPGDTVEVRATEDGDYVAIEVADTGSGIPEEESPHVWEELYRGKAARGVPGSGLGLAMVRTIVNRHGGQIDLRSRVELGTVVTIRLPIR